jgi:hypothetical protein
LATAEGGGSPEGFQLLLPGVQDSDSKLDVSTRAAAGLYAMEHGLLPGGAPQEMG